MNHDVPLNDDVLSSGGMIDGISFTGSVPFVLSGDGDDISSSASGTEKNGLLLMELTVFSVFSAFSVLLMETPQDGQNRAASSTDAPHCVQKAILSFSFKASDSYICIKIHVYSVHINYIMLISACQFLCFLFIDNPFFFLFYCAISLILTLGDL